LLKNPAWKREFLNGIADLLNSWYSPARAGALTDTLRDELRPAMDEHIRRWRANGGSVAAWETRVRTVRDFATQRAGRVRSQLRSQFGLRGQSRVTLDVDDPVSGSVRINRLLVNRSLPGVNPNPYPWTGVYFNDVPVSLEAVPAPGWQFAGWIGLEAAGSVATWIPNGNLNVTARFVADSPKLRVAELNPDGMQLLLLGTPGADYTVQVSADLFTWSDAGEATCDSAGQANVPLARPPGEPSRFIRVTSR
jgi:hypothetical protein